MANFDCKSVIIGLYLTITIFFKNRLEMAPSKYAKT